MNGAGGTINSELFIKSNALSCDAMAQLAIKEAVGNQTIFTNQTIGSHCPKIRDVKEETDLQLKFGHVYNRDVCFNKPADYGIGPWTKALDTGAGSGLYTNAKCESKGLFNENTRNKVKGATCYF